MSIRARVWGLAVSAVILGLTIWPVSWPTGRDSFPLSSYPMFARREVNPTVHLHYAVGFDGGGGRHVIGPEYVANSEVLQARAALSRAVTNKAKTDALCRSIAERVASDDDFDSVIEVRIITGRHDAVAYLRGETTGHERIRGRCEVSR